MLFHELFPLSAVPCVTWLSEHEAGRPVLKFQTVICGKETFVTLVFEGSTWDIVKNIPGLHHTTDCKNLMAKAQVLISVWNKWFAST